MTDDIRSLTARLADEPGSLAFLELAEALRRRGQLDAAYRVARGGVAHYPGLADAHDLFARVLSDQGDLAGAFDAWSSALQLDPMRAGALKGIGFLYFRAGDRAAALDHLQRARELDPDDRAIPQALARIGSGAAEPAPTGSAVTASGPPALFVGMEGGDQGLLLVDASGLRLGGRLAGEEGAERGDRVAAELAGVAREAARATRLLGLGGWQTIVVEAADRSLVLAQPTADTVLLAMRDASVPAGRVSLLAERAARAAREWLEAEA